MYFVITPGSKSGPRVEYLTQEKLLERLNDKSHYGCCHFLDHAPKTYPDDEWYTEDGSGVLIIKGEIVVPKPKEVVTTWEV